MSALVEQHRLIGFHRPKKTKRRRDLRKNIREIQTTFSDNRLWRVIDCGTGLTILTLQNVNRRRFRSNTRFYHIKPVNRANKEKVPEIRPAEMFFHKNAYVSTEERVFRCRKRATSPRTGIVSCS